MIVISYGLPKSASTFMVNLLKRACEVGGSNQEELKDRVFVGNLAKHRNFLGDAVRELPEISENISDNEMLVVKTHSRLTPEIKAMLSEGKAIAFASYRHPGDAALSAYEAGASERAAGKSVQFARLDTHLKAIDTMIGHVNSTTIPWLKSGLAHSFSYNQATQDGVQTARKIAAVIGIDADDLLRDTQVVALLSGKKRVYNFNKGVSGRYMDVFSPEDRAYLEEKCADFIRFCNGELDTDAL